MVKKQIPKTDLFCFPLCLGSVSFGTKMNYKQSARLMDIYTEYGGNFIDTAEVYANWLPAVEKSMAEKTIGRWMQERGNRENLIVTTKGGHPLPDKMDIPRLSKKEIEEDLYGSLQRLGVESIDLYFLHRDDESRPVEEILKTMNHFVKKGLIRYFGCSNWTTKRMKEAEVYAQKHHLQGFTANQPMFSAAYIEGTKLSDQTLVAMDKEMEQFHEETLFPAFAYSSQAKGLFTKMDSGMLSFGGGKMAPEYDSEKNQKRLNAIWQTAQETGATINQTALGFLLSKPFPVFPIIGCRTEAQLQDSLGASQLQLTHRQVESIQS